jgi:hypothetical protein
MHLNGNIRHLLYKGRLSVARLANIVGMHQPTLFRILGHPGRKPRSTTIKPIADLLGVSTTDLLHTDLKTQIENVITKNPFGLHNKMEEPEKKRAIAEQIRVRIMSEAYDLADRNDAEGYNSVKIMCSDVLAMIKAHRQWVGLTDDDIAQAMFRADAIITGPMQYRFAGEVEAALRSKNT